MEKISFYLNDKFVEITLENEITLLEMLREKFNLTGTKKGCGAGDCGACTVLVDNRAVNSCLFLASDLDGKRVLTIEGLEKDGELDPIQQSFVENGAVQCGYCIPGMVLSAKALLSVNDSPTEDEIKRSISGNLCRCTGYVRIIKSIQDAAQKIQSAGTVR